MFRMLAFALTLLGTSVAWGQTTYDPKIAYAQVSGTAQYVYLANADGTRAVRVATVPRDSNGFHGNVKGVDLSPTRNQVAFADSQGLKLVRFTPSNTGIRVDGVDLLVAGPWIASPDFTADGSGILYHAGGTPSSFSAVSASGGPPVVICNCTGMYPRWLKSNATGDGFAFVRILSNPSSYQLWSARIAADGTVTTTLELSTSDQAFTEINDFDVSRVRNAVILSTWWGAAGARMVDFDLDTRALTVKGSGVRAHYSANDSRIIHVSPHTAAGDYVQALDVASGSITRLTKKGSFSVTDARP